MLQLCYNSKELIPPYQFLFTQKSLAICQAFSAFRQEKSKATERLAFLTLNTVGQCQTQPIYIISLFLCRCLISSGFFYFQFLPMSFYPLQHIPIFFFCTNKRMSFSTLWSRFTACTFSDATIVRLISHCLHLLSFYVQTTCHPFCSRQIQAA